MQRSRHVTVQQQQIRRQLGQSNTFTFFNVLTGPELFDPLEALLPAHRERRFPPTETLAMFLRQALSEDRSCQRGQRRGRGPRGRQPSAMQYAYRGLLPRTAAPAHLADHRTHPT